MALEGALTAIYFGCGSLGPEVWAGPLIFPKADLDATTFFHVPFSTMCQVSST